MPYEKDVPERKWWLCPKWYWPFAVCSGIRTQHKWCYNFSWTTRADYLFVAHFEGCENGKLYTWTKPTFGISGTTYTVPVGETCFDSSLGHDEGVCDPSNTGMMASQLERAAPSASSIIVDTTTLTSKEADSGTFNFDGEYETQCRKGAWPWTLTMHQEMISAVVTVQHMEVSWTVAGIPINDAGGVLTIAVLCAWPMPLPEGKSQNKAVQVRYLVERDATKSKLKLFNDPKDGTYSFSIAARATASSGEVETSFTSEAFHGQTCDFNPQQIEDLIKCWTSQIVVHHKPVEFVKPVPDDYVVKFREEFWRLLPRSRRPMVESIAGVMNYGVSVAPTVFADAMTFLEQQTGVPSASRLMSIQAGAVEKGECGACRRVSALAKPIALGLLAIAIVYLARRGRQVPKD